MAMSFVEASTQFLAAATEFAALRATASLSFWIVTTQSGNDTIWDAPGVVGIEEAGADDDIFWTTISGSGLVQVARGNDGPYRSTSQMNDGGLHHVLITWNSSTGVWQIYFDGVYEGGGTGGTVAVTNTFNSLARIEDTGGTPRYLDGLLDDIRIYNRILLAHEAAAIHTQRGADTVTYGLVSKYRLKEMAPGVVATGTVNDETTTSNNCTPTNSPTYAESTIGRRRAA